MKQKELQLIVKKAKQGDKQAFEQLYQEYADSIYYFALKLTHSEADAKDIVQETFIQAYKSLPDLKEEKVFKAWLNRITFTKATRLFAKHKDRLFDNNESYYIDHLKEQRVEMLPKELVHNKQSKEIMHRLLLQLPPAQSSVLHLMYMENMSMQQIADILDIPLGTVKSRLHTGKKQLLKIIQEWEEKEHTKITFYNLPAGAVLWFLSYKHLWKKPQVKKAMYTGTAMTICSVLAIAILGQKDPANLQASKIIQVDFQGKQYTRADDIYYKLKEFSHCLIELKEKEETEIQEYQVMYQELKDFGGIYYELLQEDGWDEVFK